MNTEKVTSRYIILVPHRDAANSFDGYRKYLFSCGVCGALSFPTAAPLAEAASPLNAEELKELARNIRGLTAETAGKIICGPASAAAESGRISFFGPALNLLINEKAFPEAARPKIIKIFSPPVLCAGIFSRSNGENLTAPKAAPALSFSAAALANLAIRPLASGEAGYSMEWKTGPLVWLPRLHEAF